MAGEGNATIVARALFGLMLRAREEGSSVDDTPPEEESPVRASFVLDTPMGRMRVDITEIGGRS